MTRAEFDTLCGSMKGTTHVVQWGGASVWKIGGRIFAICSKWGAGNDPKISFKCSELQLASQLKNMAYNLVLESFTNDEL